MVPFMSQNEVFRKLAEIVDVNSLTAEEHTKYDSSIKLLRDNIAVYQGAVQEGIEKGRAEGREEGLKEGRKEGIEEGKANTIRQLLSSGMSKETIASALKMDMTELEALLGE